MSKRKVIWRRILIITLSCILGLLLIGGISFAFIWNSEELDQTKLTSVSQSAVFYDNENQIINTPQTKKFYQLTTINPDCINAFIAVEDKNFYQHHGLSYPRIIKALINNLAAGYSKEGASTITQQLIKNTHLTNEKTLKRKLREAILALKLEQKYSKSEILEIYLNAIYFGNNLYGIGNASEFYFQKTPQELSLAESAGLAGMIKNPTKYDPINSHDQFMQRAHLVLKLMHEQALIDDTAYQTALTEALTIAPHDTIWIGTCYQTMALKEASQLLNLSETDIIHYGYQIETYYDATKQKLIYNAMNEPEYNLNGEKFALLATTNGQVNALWTSNPTLLTARRNFGSAMKPLLVYAPALELGIIQPETQIDDSPLIGSDFNPKNSGNKYHGLVSARTALAHSYNIPAVKILNATTIPQATALGNRLGLNLEDENLSMALGNTHKGNTFLELAGGYQTIANQGKYTPARFIRTIRDRNGQTVYFDLSNKYNYAPQALTQDTAYLLTDMMLETTRTGTARKLSYLNMDIAAKTGTTERANTNTNTDATLVSFTPSNVLITWHGNATMKPEDDLPAGDTGGGKLANATKQIHSVISTPREHFTRPTSIKEIRLDAMDYQKGDLKLANLNTPEHETVTALFANKYVPETVSDNYMFTTSPIIDGKINETNLPEIWFDTLKHQTYQIYKNDILQEVIHNRNGEYVFIDYNPTINNTYRVEASINGNDPQNSNSVTLRLNNTQNSTKPVERTRRPWYF